MSSQGAAKIKLTEISALPEFINAPLMDFMVTCEHPGLLLWIKELSRPKQQSLFSTSTIQCERALLIVILNILKHKDQPFLTISKSWNDYPPASRYNKKPMALSEVIAAIEFLRDQAWIVIHPGSKATGLRTRIEVTAGLRTEFEMNSFSQIRVKTSVPDEAIVLRSGERELVDYAETKWTLAARRRLHKINNSNTQHLVMFSGRRLNTHLVRIFKSSFTEGGRFYRAEHLSLKSTERRTITIDNESVVEADFACLHINMLYIQETGAVYDGDAYAVPNSALPRDVFKIILQIILNADSKLSALHATKEALKTFKLKHSESTVIELFLKKHKALQNHFFSGVGVKLQYLDSLIAEQVLLAGVANGIAVLPVHDSFLCGESHQEWLVQAMAEASKVIMGCALPVKIKTNEKQLAA